MKTQNQNTTTLRLSQTFPFASNVPFVELENERILCNNVIFPGEFNPHQVRLWVIGNEFGALGAVWADCETDAFDELCDAGLANDLLIEPDDEDEESAHIGNAGEPADLSNAWMATVKLDPTMDFALMMKLAEARGACADHLSNL